MFGSLRYNLGHDCKSHVMEQIGNFNVNEIAACRIKRNWAKTKASYSKGRQGAARAKLIRGQAQSTTSSVSRLKAEAVSKGEGQYMTSQEVANQGKRKSREALKRATKK